MKKFLYSILMMGFVLSPIFSFASDTLYEDGSFTITDYEQVKGNNWYGMEFTGSTEDHTITSVMLRGKSDISTNILRVAIYAENADKPTGGEICGADYDYTGLPTSYTTIEISLSCSHIVMGTKYFIVVSAPSATANIDDFRWGYDSGDNLSSSSNGGVSWSTAGTGTGRHWFQIYGVPYEETPPDETATSTSFSNASTTAILGSIAFGETIIIVFFFLFFCGYIWKLWDKRKRAWQ